MAADEALAWYPNLALPVGLGAGGRAGGHGTGTGCSGAGVPTPGAGECNRVKAGCGMSRDIHPGQVTETWVAWLLARSPIDESQDWDPISVRLFAQSDSSAGGGSRVMAGWGMRAHFAVCSLAWQSEE